MDNGKVPSGGSNAAWLWAAAPFACFFTTGSKVQDKTQTMDNGKVPSNNTSTDDKYIIYSII
jgi:hypothetical protein